MIFLQRMVNRLWGPKWVFWEGNCQGWGRVGGGGERENKDAQKVISYLFWSKKGSVWEPWNDSRESDDSRESANRFVRIGLSKILILTGFVASKTLFGWELWLLSRFRFALVLKGFTHYSATIAPLSPLSGWLTARRLRTPTCAWMRDRPW